MVVRMVVCTGTVPSRWFGVTIVKSLVRISMFHDVLKKKITQGETIEV